MSYRLQVADKSNFNSPAVDSSGFTSTSFQVTNLSNTTTYFWRVNGSNGTGAGDWSSTWDLNTTPPIAAQLVADTAQLWSDTFNDWELVPRLSWTVGGWCNLTYGVYRYQCTRTTTDCGLTGSLIYSGSATSYIDSTTYIGDWTGVTKWYYVKATASANGSTSNSNKVWYGLLDPSKSGLSQDHLEGSKPERTVLEGNYPDPFNPVTVIRYALSENSKVMLMVYNALGQVVRTLVDEDQTAGYKSVAFDASTLPSGAYYYRLQAGNFSDTKKFLLIK